MLEFFTSKGTWFYIASWCQNFNASGIMDSGISVIILGLGVAWVDVPFNPLRREWVIPSNAWDDIKGE